MGKNNKTVSALKLLNQKKNRDSTGLFLIEGEKFISEIPEGSFIKEYIISQSYSEKHPKYLKVTNPKIPVTVLSDSAFEAVSANKTPQGRIAVCRKAAHSLDALLVNKKNSLFIIAEELNDPGNLGTIIRTAYAAGAAGVLLSKGSVELYNPKTLQSAAGAVFHVAVIENVNLCETLPIFRAAGVQLAAAASGSGISLYEADFTKPTAIIIGNEARGISVETSRLADLCVKIPMPGGAESLNVSVACAVLIYEAIRQRQ